MSKYFEIEGKLYELLTHDSRGDECSVCAFRGGSDCGPIYEGTDEACLHSPTYFKLVAEKKPGGSMCGECAHLNLSADQAPCSACHFSENVPLGWYPKFEPRLADQLKPVGPGTRHLHERQALPEIPDGPGWAKVIPIVPETTLSEAATAPLAPADAGAKPTNPKDAIGIRKVPMSCVPAGVMMEVALALGEGAAKYGRHNYRGVGVRASVYYDAGVGHLMDWWEGDDIDAESGLSHVTKAIASLVVLRDAMLQGKLTDDRPPRSKVFKRDFNPLMGEILDRHADKNPKHWTISD